MKIKIETKELMELLAETATLPEIKEKVAGELVSLVMSPEMKKTMSEVIMDRVEQTMNDALEIRGTNYYGGKTLGGWAAQALQEHLIKELKEVRIESMVREEVRRQVDQRVGLLVQEHVGKVFTNEWAEKALAYLAEKNLAEIVERSVKAQLRGLIGA